MTYIPSLPWQSHNTHSPSSWGDHGVTFDTLFTEGTSTASSRMIELATKLHPITADSRVLDVGCGPGACVEAVRRMYPEVPIVATDFAPGMIEVLRRKNIPKVVAGVADARALDRNLVPDRSFTHTFGALMIQFCGPQGQFDVLREFLRALKPGGVAGIIISRNTEIADPWHAACEELDPTYVDRKLVKVHDDGAWMTLEDVEQGFAAVGFDRGSILKEWMKLEFCMSTKTYLEFWYNGNHPGYSGEVTAAWGRDPEEVRPVLEKVLNERYQRMARIHVDAGIVVAQKPTG